jgi:Outer membrane protein beta-barrel domain
MRLKLFPPLCLALLLVFSTHRSFSQVKPEATHRTIPITVGVGFSAYNPDWNSSPLLGGTLWVDYMPTFLPRPLEGLGIEAEARDLSLNRSSSQPSNLREDVASGGVIYSWSRYYRFRPYGKFLMGYGNTDYKSIDGSRYNQSRTVTTAGGGVETQALHHFWVRADYEYQWWPDFFKGTHPAGKLNPEGITLGVSYHFNQPPVR